MQGTRNEHGLDNTNTPMEVKRHVASCPFLRTGVACCLPTWQGSSISVTQVVENGAFL